MKPVLALRQVPHEGLGLLEELLLAQGIRYEYIDMFGDKPDLFDPADWSGLIVLGGPMNVDQTDRYPWLADETEWIQTALDANLPLLGICLGSQLLAKALGARVMSGDRKEIGWYEIELTDKAGDDLLFGGCRSQETVFQWHGDTFDLPEGAILLASSRLFPHQAFRYGERAYGIQFHLEVTAAMIDKWLSIAENRSELDTLDYIDLDEIRRSTIESLPTMHLLAERLFTPFLELCREEGSAR